MASIDDITEQFDAYMGAADRRRAGRSRNNSNRATIAGKEVTYILGKPTGLYGGPRYLLGLSLPRRWYCVVVDGEDVGHVVRVDSGHGAWRIDRFTSIDHGPHALEATTYRSRQEAVEALLS